jgi:hypothetical protein
VISGYFYFFDFKVFMTFEIAGRENSDRDRRRSFTVSSPKTSPRIVYRSMSAGLSSVIIFAAKIIGSKAFRKSIKRYSVSSGLPWTNSSNTRTTSETWRGNTSNTISLH